MTDRGPYTNERGDWWFPVDAWGWNEAQREAALFARESDYVARYQGIKVTGCHDHEDWEESSEECCRRRAYHFRDVDPFAVKEDDDE